jgi:HK97 gp10 family phage protein
MVLRSNLSKIAQRAPEFASEALLQTGADIVNIAKQLVPVDTGHLQASIGAEPIDSKTVVVGTDVEYSIYVEFGTESQAAQPYFIPAFTQSEETFKARLEQKIKEAADA